MLWFPLVRGWLRPRMLSDGETQTLNRIERDILMCQVGLLFPGQGAQKVGMGKDFYDTSAEAKALFQKADEILSLDLSQTIFEGPQEKLTSTAYSQPAIFTVSMAAFTILCQSEVFQGWDVCFTAGLSLGEYSALAAAGAFSFEDGLRLVSQRSRFMEEATKKEKGTMAAVIGFDKDKLVAICRETGAEIANFNSHEQIVITGRVDSVKAACEKITAAGAKSVIPLDVSGAFHSSLMQAAADNFQKVLESVEIQEPKIPVIANVNGQPEKDPETIRKNLALQITSSVQWVASIEYMAGQGISHFIEVGPGRVLRGLLRKINPDLKVANVQTPGDIEKLKEFIG